jgi:hypothetical protein
VYNFYRNYITLPKFPKTYMPRAPIRSKGTDQIVAMRLEIGLFVPVAPIQLLPQGITFPLEEESVAEMEWVINRKLAVHSVALEEGVGADDSRLRQKEMNEAYEHLRLTFSNWLASIEDGGEFRRGLEEIIYNRSMQLFEKRKRLEILLASEIESWIAESDESAPRNASLLRVDCRLRDEEGCDGMCEWQSDEGRCLLHVPATSPIEDTVASGGRVLMLRLIEELLRYAGRRKELFEQRVSELAVLENPLRIKDQFIVPENSAAWVELLRLEWARDKTEEPRYLEEMTRLAPIEAEEEAEDVYERPTGFPANIRIEGTTTAPAPKKFKLTSSSTTTIAPKKFQFPQPAAGEPAPKKFQFKRTPPMELPPVLKTLFGEDDPKTAPLHLFPTPSGGVGFFLDLFRVAAADLGIDPNAVEFTESEIGALVRASRVPILQIDLRTEEPTLFARRLNIDKDAKGYPVFVLQDNYPPSLVVANPAAPAALKRAELPDALYQQFMSGIKVFAIKINKERADE